MSQEHSPKVSAGLDRLSSRRTDLMDIGKRMLDSAGGDLYTVDMFAIGAAKRTMSLLSGFDALVRSWNLTCARALLRLQIDTALRFGALTLVENRDSFVNSILGGQRIDRIKDRLGHRLTDAYLVDCFKSKAPWLPEVYKRTSGYVHLSDQHMFAAVHGVNDESRTITWVIGAEDNNFPEFSWLEAIDCFDAAVGMFAGLLESWVQVKAGLQPKSPQVI